MTDPSAESRDRAIAEANALRQEVAELSALLSALCKRNDDMDTPEGRDANTRAAVQVMARALLAKGTP